ncbi:hypothetical protein FRC04_009884 [Tulasnella sp. 424]|nr:hypothetical protein FRC04_009884 [Tulasnella sp. 424]
MLRAANQQQRAQAESEHQDTTALLLRIHSIPDNLLFPFSSSDPPSPAGAHLRTGTDVASTSRPKEASSQDTIRPSSFQHVRSYTIQQNTSGDSDSDDATSSADPIAIWVSLSPCRGHMNITLFEGWRIVVQVPVRDWEDRVYTADDVKRAAMICMGRQLMGEKIICVPIDVRWSFESGEEGEDAHSHALESERRRRGSQAQSELDDFEVSSFRQSTDSSQSQLAIHIRRPSAPEPDTPDASTAENGHSPLEPRLLQQQRSFAPSSSPSLPTPRRIAAMPDALSSTWSSSLANSESIQDYVTAPDHEDADQGVVIPPQSRSSVQSAAAAQGESPPGAVRSHSTRRTSWDQD